MFANYLYPDGRVSRELVCVLNVLSLSSAVITDEAKEHYGLAARPGHYVNTTMTLDGQQGGKLVHGKWRVMRRG